VKKVIKIGSQVSKSAGVAGLLASGVVTRVDVKNEIAGVMWRIEGGLLAQTEKFSNLIVIEENEER